MKRKKRALITGITGQDGAYLAKLLLGQDYEVWGTHRRSSSLNTWRLAELGILGHVMLVDMDLFEFSNIVSVIADVRPDEVYNLAAQSFVGTSFKQPLYTAEIDALGVTRLLEALRGSCPDARFYQASTSEMFGKVQAIPQDEQTPFYPRSPYGVAKLYAHWMTVNYREAHGLFAASGILFNHESPLRGTEFVTRKITVGLSRIQCGQQDLLELGNLDAKRDWGFAGDYVRGMWLMLQQPHASDYVLATGETHTVREFVTAAARHLDMNLEWQGSGLECCAIDTHSGKVVVRVNPELYRAAEVDLLLGSAEKAMSELAWQPEVSFSELVERMIRADANRVARGMSLS